jgi:sensor domain CHASE-containing protein
MIWFILVLNIVMTSLIVIFFQHIKVICSQIGLIRVEMKTHADVLAEKIEKQMRANIELEKTLTQPIVNKPFPEIHEYKPPANRKPRTDEQKRKASEQRKLWWANKRERERQNDVPTELSQ